MIIRLTDKLAKKIKENKLANLPTNANLFADWSARLFTFERVHYILITNTATLYSTVIYGKGVRDYSGFIDAMADSLRDMMEEDGFRETYYAQIAPQTASTTFAKSLNRSIVGSMNQLAFYAQVHLSAEEVSHYDLSLRLNEGLMSYGKKYDQPKEVFRRAIQELSNVVPIRR